MDVSAATLGIRSETSGLLTTSIYGHNTNATNGYGIVGKSDGSSPFTSVGIKGIAENGGDALQTDGPSHLNVDAQDFDFQMEGLTDANLLFGDASTDRIGIGSNTPTAKLYVRIPNSITGTQDQYVIRSYLLHGSGSGTSNLRGAYLEAKSNSHSGSNNIYGSYGNITFR